MRFLLLFLSTALISFGALIAACGGDQTDQSAEAPGPAAQPAPAAAQARQDDQARQPDAAQATQQADQQQTEEQAVQQARQDAAEQPAAPGANVRDGAIGEFGEGVDYFPEKATVLDAENFTVSYHGYYKRVRVLETSPGGGPAEYLLVQRGAPDPPDIGDATVVRVPIESIFTSSTTHLPALSVAGALDRLAGVAQGDFISDAEAYARVQSGDAVVFAPAYSVDAEIVVASAPDVLMTSGFEDDAYELISASGTAIVHNGDWIDSTALGRAEWVKFTALFFNAEAESEAWYGDLRARYLDAKALADGAAERPTVHTGIVYGGIWYASGGRSYVARLLADAGADYVWKDDETTGSIPTDLEVQLAVAGDADYWLHAGSAWADTDAAFAEDARYGEFRSARLGNVWNNTLATNERGANDYFETGAVRPDLVLQDLIAIFHPELMPGHEFRYYRNLAPPTERPRRTYDERPPFALDDGVDYYAVVEMAGGGSFELELFARDAPETVNSFVFLAREGFYDGLPFHRVIDGFVAQGGDPRGDGTGGPGYSLPLEISDRRHEEGCLAMARARDPDSGGSQFYICLADLPHLDGSYAVFGRVAAGMEAVRAIPLGEPPDQPGRIRSITIEER